MNSYSIERMARIAGWLVLAAGIAVSLVPGEVRPHSGLPGTAEHFAAYFAGGFLLRVGYRGRVSAGVVALLLILGAGALEVVQYFVPGRYAGWTDFFASAAGAAAGAALGGLVGAVLRRLAGGTAVPKE